MIPQELEDELRDELGDDLPLDLQEEVIETVNGEGSGLPIDEALRVTVEKVPADTTETSHPHFDVTGSQMVFCLNVDDARIFDARVLDPMVTSLALTQDLQYLDPADVVDETDDAPDNETDTE